MKFAASSPFQTSDPNWVSFYNTVQQAFFWEHYFLSIHHLGENYFIGCLLDFSTQLIKGEGNGKIFSPQSQTFLWQDHLSEDRMK
jgi:hypothetical protein